MRFSFHSGQGKSHLVSCMNNFADIDHKLNEYVCKYELNKNNNKRTTIKENNELNQNVNTVHPRFICYQPIESLFYS